MRIIVKAFGCKLNQCEAGAIERNLASIGHEITKNAPFDLAIVCGCTVTVRADYKVRQYIRRLRRENGVERIILSGCSAVNFKNTTIEELGIERTFTRNDPVAIADYIGRGDLQSGGLHTFHGRTRGYVKIQDGCNQFCTYCIVPLVRGRERSVPPDDIVRRIAELERAGIREAVLTGVHDGRYKHGDLDLAGLCRYILDETGIFRVRLSSIEVTEITDELVSIVAESGRIAPHLHVPLQSGSDPVLERMGRPYTGTYFREIIDKLADKVDNIGIGADVIVGFPGETDSEFDETYSLIESSPLSYLHVFRYSQREGTVAATMPDQVPNDIKRARMERLIALKGRLQRRFSESQIGILQSVIVERIDDGIGSGLTGNYIRVEFPIDCYERNNILLLNPISYNNGVMQCTIRDTV